MELEERAGGARITGLLATDINPSTATITELSYSPDESATAVFANGREERDPLAPGSRARVVAVGEEGKLHDATGAEDSGALVLVRVAVDSAFLKADSSSPTRLGSPRSTPPTAARRFRICRVPTRSST